MPGFAVNLAASIACPHQATATIAPTAPGPPKVFVNLVPVATMAHRITIAACPFQVPVGAGTKPQPCVPVTWGNPSTKVLVMGSPVLLQAPPLAGPAAGMCRSVEQIPQGPPVVRSMISKVTAL